MPPAHLWCWPPAQCDCPLGQATLPDYIENNSHYLWLAYDLFDPDGMNRQDHHNAGGNVLIHEVRASLWVPHTCHIHVQPSIRLLVRRQGT
jgi:hypothetical protein